MQIKQIVITGRHKAVVEMRELDATLGPEEMLVRTEWTFISAGTELANFAARDPAVFTSGSWCAYPWKPGYANVGVIEGVGTQVARFKTGDRVFSFGPHAAVVKLNEHRLVVPVPAEIEPCVAAATRMAGIGLSSLVMADLRIHPWVVVFGLGLVGNLAAQAFQILGGRVIGVDPVDSRRRLAETCGLRWTVGGSAEEAHQELMRLMGGELADIAVDATGLMPVVLQALRATATMGQVILLGSPRVPFTGDLTQPFAEIHLRNLTVRGALEWCPPVHPVVSATGGRSFPVPSIYGKQTAIFDWVREGQMKVEPLITHRLPATKIQEAYEGLLHNPETYVGVALDWRGVN